MLLHCSYDFLAVSVVSAPGRCRGSVRSPISVVDKISVVHLFSGVLCCSVLVQVPTGTSLVSYQCPLTAVILGSQRHV